MQRHRFSIAVDVPTQEALDVLDVGFPLRQSMRKVATNPVDHIFDCLPILERCPSVRHLDITDVQPTPSQTVHRTGPFQLTHLSIKPTNAQLSVEDVFALFRKLPALRNLSITALSELTDGDRTRPLPLPPFSLDHYYVYSLHRGCALPIVASQASLRSLGLWQPLSPAFMIPGAVNGDYTSPNNAAHAAEARYVFDASLLVAPQLNELSLNAQRRSQSLDNPEPSHLPHLLPIFSACRALRRLTIQVQLDTDPERDELRALLAAIRSPLTELCVCFKPLINEVRRITGAAAILPELQCLHRLRVLRVFIVRAGNNQAAIEEAFDPFYSFCQARRVSFVRKAWP